MLNVCIAVSRLNFPNCTKLREIFSKVFFQLIFWEHNGKCFIEEYRAEVSLVRS